MNEDNNNSEKQKGFSGLSSLVSNIDEDIAKKISEVKPENTSHTKTSITTQKNTQSTRSENNNSQTSQSPQNNYSNNASNPSSKNWIWIVLVIIIVIVIANSDNKPTSNTKYTESSSKESNKYRNPTKPTPKYPIEKKPPIGRNQVLTSSNIRYCLAEKIRLDGAESVINNYSQYDVNRFNSMVNAYNSRCGEFRYRSSALGIAERDINPFRNHYWTEGKRRFVSINSNTKPKAKPNPTILAVQRALNKLGYNAGPADGYMGKNTRSAILAYQSDSKISHDGIASNKLLTILELDLLINKM